MLKLFQFEKKINFLLWYDIDRDMGQIGLGSNRDPF